MAANSLPALTDHKNGLTQTSHFLIVMNDG